MGNAVIVQNVSITGSEAGYLVGNRGHSLSGLRNNRGGALEMPPGVVAVPECPAQALDLDREPVTLCVSDEEPGQAL